MSTSSAAPASRRHEDLRHLVTLAAAVTAVACTTAACSPATTPPGTGTTGPRPRATSEPSTTPDPSNGATPTATLSAARPTVPAPSGTSIAPRDDAARPDGVQLLAYELPTGMVRLSPRVTSRNPTQVHGVLALPAGQGARPVVMILHGSHPVCADPADAETAISREALVVPWALVCRPKPGSTRAGTPAYVRYDAGLGYLAEALAARGFVAVSIDVTAAEQWWNGEPSGDTYDALITAQLRLLDELNRGTWPGLGTAGRGRIDTGRIALVGHSRGGGHVLRAATSAHRGLFGLVALEPAEPGAPDLGRPTVPVMVVRGGCDEDTGPNAGLASARVLARAKTTSTVLDVLVPGLGHAMINTALRPTPTGPSPQAGCAPKRLLDPTTARDQVAQLTAEFLVQASRQSRAYRLPVIGSARPQLVNLVTTGTSVRPVAGRAASYVPARRVTRLRSTRALLPAVPAGLVLSEGTDGI